MNEECGLKDYVKNMNILDARTFFASQAKMIRTVQMNFKQLNAGSHYKCTCKEEDNHEHLTSCDSYNHLREGLDLEGRDLDLVRHYQLVIKEREKEEEIGGREKTEVEK